ncbi:hypothetical protein A3F66_06530 [candidate division TM6 bacterium RIFCSPHIGHO2_12_FULL_32_22]|nr:MAG: hypothetical protein A3F66_06530 [candidate division TM6 bacterium RIFCSPHIGHO2_12_FULL_32_22]
MKKLSVLLILLVGQSIHTMDQAGPADVQSNQELQDALFRAIKAAELDEELIRDIAQQLGTLDIYDGMFSPIGYAVEIDNVPLAQLLLSLGANPNEYSGPEDETLLMIAIENQSPEMFKTLLHYGADADIPAIASDQTARSFAIGEDFRGNPEFVEALKKYMR